MTAPRLDPAAVADDPAFAAMLGRRAVTARREAKLSQDAAAQAIGISRNYLSQVERGKASVAAWIVGRLARIYAYPVGYFYGESDARADRTLAAIKTLSAEEQAAIIQLAEVIKYGRD